MVADVEREFAARLEVVGYERDGSGLRENVIVRAPWGVVLDMLNQGRVTDEAEIRGVMAILKRRRALRSQVLSERDRRVRSSAFYLEGRLRMEAAVGLFFESNRSYREWMDNLRTWVKEGKPGADLDMEFYRVYAILYREWGLRLILDK